MYIYEKKLNPEKPKDPSIGVTRWSTARDVEIVAHSGSTSLLLTMSPDLANRLAWALLEAADKKPGDAA